MYLECVYSALGRLICFGIHRRVISNQGAISIRGRSHQIVAQHNHTISRAFPSNNKTIIPASAIAFRMKVVQISSTLSSVLANTVFALLSSMDIPSPSTQNTSFVLVFVLDCVSRTMQHFAFQGVLQVLTPRPPGPWPARSQLQCRARYPKSNLLASDQTGHLLKMWLTLKLSSKLELPAQRQRHLPTAASSEMVCSGRRTRV